MPELKRIEAKEFTFSFNHVSHVIEHVRPPEWVVESLFETDSLSMIFGDPESGKSLAAIDMGLCCAAGVDWHGLKTKQGSVFYIAGEGFNALGRRFAACCAHRSINPAAIPFYASECSAQFISDDSSRSVTLSIEALHKETGIVPVLIIVDTVARNFGGGNENSTEDIGRMVSNVDAYLRNKFNATVLFIHHTGHSEKHRARGSMALKAALDSEFRMSKDEATGGIRFECTKSKDSRPADPMGFKLETVSMSTSDGMLFDSVVLANDKYIPQKQAKTLGANQENMLNLLISMCSNGETDGVPSKKWRQTALSQGVIGNTRFYEVKNSLLRNNLIKENDGKVFPV